MSRFGSACPLGSSFSTSTGCSWSCSSLIAQRCKQGCFWSQQALLMGSLSESRYLRYLTQHLLSEVLYCLFCEVCSSFAIRSHLSLTSSWIPDSIVVNRLSVKLSPRCDSLTPSNSWSTANNFCSALVSLQPTSSSFCCWEQMNSCICWLICTCCTCCMRLSSS